MINQEKLATNLPAHYKDDVLVIYTEASFAPNEEESETFLRSMGGMIVVWAGSVVAWMTKKQSLVKHSSAEAELYQAVEGWTLGTNVQTILAGMGVQLKLVLALDNKAAIQICTNIERPSSWRTRHLKLSAAALREKTQRKELKIT